MDEQHLLSVAVLGAQGRMGRASCEAIEAAPDLDLVATIGSKDIVDKTVRSSGAQVAVDFTVPDVVEEHVHTLIDLGVHAVVGATGWTSASLDRVRDHLASSSAAQRVSVLIAPNFSLSAVLAMSFAAKAAPYFESAEVIELHHPDKVDAPSGTARHTAQAIAAARETAETAPSPDATVRGWDARGVNIDGVRVHAVRLRGLTAHEEILFGNPGEQFSIRQDSFERSSFMPGVLLGIRQAAHRPGLTVGLEHLMDLA